MGDPADVIGEFERIALNDSEDLPIDDAVAGLAQILADEPMPEEIYLALLMVGATLYRRGLSERMRAAGLPS